MALQKITEAQMDEKGVCAAPNVLKGQPAENKALFDRMVRQLVAPAYNAAVDAIGEINETESGIQAAESARAAAEAARSGAERGRAAAETARASAEAARASAETGRGNAETARAEAEHGRAEAERQKAETGRARAEAERISAETERLAAEQVRAETETARNVWEPYDGGRDYVPGNKVSSGGSSYLNVKACKGVRPPSAAHWIMIAARGVDGEGAGDMLAEVYDPQGKAQDMFAFAEAAVSAHAQDTVSHVTAAERDAWNAKANAVHAAQHAAGGADPITPAAIGAAAANHTHTPASIGAAAAWKLIAQYKTAGSYTWTVPAGVTQIGVYMVGGGGSGANGSQGSQTYYPTGGAAGYGKNIELTVIPGWKIAVVVGAGGAGTTGNTERGNAGGTTAFNGVTVLGGAGGTWASTQADGANGGQGSDPNPGFRAATVPMYGSCPTQNTSYSHGGLSQSPRESQNRFDPGMVTLCAGGAPTQTVMAMPDGTKGGDGASGKDCVAGSATGNGNGGGASFVGNLTDRTTSGSGSPGMILIYAKAV